MNKLGVVCVICGSIICSACGTITGIPSHGGGKRFAIEQELVSAASRKAIKDVDLTTLAGKKVAVFVDMIGDAGSGTMVGGRYQFEAAIRGSYINTPVTRMNYQYPVATTATVGQSTTAGVTTATQSIAEQALNAPVSSEQETKGNTSSADLGIAYQRPQYNANPVVNNDSRHFGAVLENALRLNEITVVAPQNAEVFLYVTVDVYGTVHQRTDYLVANRERLEARTVFEVTAFDNTGKVIMGPKFTGYEAQYSENFSFWMGPVSVTKELHKIGNYLGSQ